MLIKFKSYKLLISFISPLFVLFSCGQEVIKRGIQQDANQTTQTSDMICPENTLPNGKGQCLGEVICNSPSELNVNNQCISSDYICSNGAQADLEGICPGEIICQPGYDKVGDLCVDTNAGCQEGLELYAGSCHLPGGGWYEAGLGLPERPFEIKSCAQLQNVSKRPLSHFVLQSDIDCNAHLSWEPIGTRQQPFVGTFDGRHFKIKNLNSPTGPLFGVVGVNDVTALNSEMSSNVVLKNLIVENFNTVQSAIVRELNNQAKIEKVGVINSRVNAHTNGGVGCIAQWLSSAHLDQVFCQDVELFGNKIGGLVYIANNRYFNKDNQQPINKNVKPSISNSYFKGKITESNNGPSGGLVAIAEQLILSNSYAVAIQTGHGGGLFGSVRMVLDSVTVSNSFWVYESNEQGEAIGKQRSASHADYKGQSVTNLELKEKSTTETPSFIKNKGWDFTNIWIEHDTYNEGYPILGFVLQD